MNQQPIEKSVADKTDGTLLEVHSIFRTIQGEGPFCGTPAIFVRLAGCNLQCPMCDTDYTTQRANRDFQLVVDEVKRLAGSSIKLVVITGGEPFRQNLRRLLCELVLQGFFVQIETNGTLPPSDCGYYHTDVNLRYGVYIVCSPKTGKINSKLLRFVCALKYVVAHNDIDAEDGLPLHALGHPNSGSVAKPQKGFDGNIYIQPADHTFLHGKGLVSQTKNAMSVDAAVDSCMRHGYTLQLQIHKILGVE